MPVPENDVENPAVRAAMQSVEAAQARAMQDPLRPTFHFRPPAYWMNDPNGAIYADGWYHLFYQHNPYGDAWGNIHWGHARSRDLVHWEHLPIALWPSAGMGEAHCFSGCAARDEAGTPHLFYTMVGKSKTGEPRLNEQWAAIGDAEWLTWRKHPQNPILQIGGQGAPAFDGDWRDPYIFAADERTFMVVGATLGDTAGVALYEALDGALLNWQYRKLLYEKPKDQVRFFECPNFIPMGGDRFLLLTSPYTPVQYVAGRFDVETLTFTPETEGVLDPGAGEEEHAHFYASNTLFAPDGRCILLGWMRGFPPGKGWNGCLALPRELWLGPDGHPRQRPIPALETLREGHVRFEPVTLENTHKVLGGVHARAELRASMRPQGEARAGVGLFGLPSADTLDTSIMYDGATLWVAGQKIAYTPKDETGNLHLHLFIDHSTLEMFVDDGRLAVTRVLQPSGAGVQPVLFSHSGVSAFGACDLWDLATIW